MSTEVPTTSTRKRRNKKRDANGQPSKRLKPNPSNNLEDTKASAVEQEPRFKEEARLSTATALKSKESLEVVLAITPENAGGRDDLDRNALNGPPSMPAEPLLNGHNFERESKVSPNPCQAFEEDVTERPSSWTVSDSIGGRFLPFDPVFDSEEKYAFLATTHALQIYSTRTSLLVHVIRLSRFENLISFCLSPNRPDHVYISTSDKFVCLWNWRQSQLLWRWRVKWNAFCLVSVHGTRVSSDVDVLYAIRRSSSEAHVGTLQLQQGKTKAACQTIHSTKNPLRDLRVLCQGMVVLAMSDFSIELLRIPKSAAISRQKISFHESISCFDARSSQINHKYNPNEELDSSAPVDLVVGTDTGAIFVYSDVESMVEKRGRKLHWHREKVSALKWSLDGISVTVLLPC